MTQSHSFSMQDAINKRPQFIIGRIETINFASATARLDRDAFEALRASTDAAVRISGGIGGQVKIFSEGSWALCNIRDTKVEHGGDGTIIISIDFLGEAVQNEDGSLSSFRRGLTRYPHIGDDVFAVTQPDMDELFGPDTAPHIEIGTVYPTSSVRASLLIDPLLGKHFALLGSTGSGKSTAAALILHRIIDKSPEGHIVVLDPHGEYSAAFATKGVNFNVDNLQLPYWLMNFEEHCEVFVTSDGSERDLDCSILAKCLLAARSKSTMASRYPELTVDSPVPYMVADLVSALDAQMGKLEHSSEISRYLRVKNRIESIQRDSRYTFMFNRSLVADTMKLFLSRILRLPSLGKPISVIDLSGVPSDIVSVVVALLSRIVMDYAIWSRQERQRPILLVCEEAHRYVPAELTASGAAVRKALERIAKEGRKYGVALALVTQRPSDLAEGTLSQCGTIISMRLNNERDQTCVRNAMPEGGRSFLDAIPALRKGECIISGEGVAIPLRVQIDMLEEELRPRSEDPSFARQWCDVGGEDEALDRTISRWRTQDYHGADGTTGAKGHDAVSRLLSREAAPGLRNSLLRSA